MIGRPFLADVRDHLERAAILDGGRNMDLDPPHVQRQRAEERAKAAMVEEQRQRERKRKALMAVIVALEDLGTDEIDGHVEAETVLRSAAAYFGIPWPESVPDED